VLVRERGIWREAPYREDANRLLVAMSGLACVLAAVIAAVVNAHAVASRALPLRVQSGFVTPDRACGQWRA
jgi:hypothetical protein